MSRQLFRAFVIAAALTCVSSLAHAGTLAVDFTSSTHSANNNEYGYGFNLNTSKTIDGLGVMLGQLSFATDHAVGLWDDNGNLLASALVNNASSTVASADPSVVWKIEAITPVTLLAGNYRIAALYPIAAAVNVVPGALILDPAVTILGAWYAPTNGGTSLVFPNDALFFNMFPTGLFGPTFTFATAVVPEPASLALLSLGGLTLIRRRR